MKKGRRANLLPFRHFRERKPCTNAVSMVNIFSPTENWTRMYFRALSIQLTVPSPKVLWLTVTPSCQHALFPVLRGRAWRRLHAQRWTPRRDRQPFSSIWFAFPCWYQPKFCLKLSYTQQVSGFLSPITWRYSKKLGDYRTICDRTPLKFCTHN